MKRSAIQFPYVLLDPTQGELGRRPLLPLRLTGPRNFVPTVGLLDTGATVNVLPFDLGVQLGADWDQQSVPIQLTGNLKQAEARALLVTATVATFPPIQLVFAWTKLNSIPVILGQVNFFMEFDVCFFRSRAVFEINSK